MLLPGVASCLPTSLPYLLATVYIWPRQAARCKAKMMFWHCHVSGCSGPCALVWAESSFLKYYGRWDGEGGKKKMLKLLSYSAYPPHVLLYSSPVFLLSPSSLLLLNFWKLRKKKYTSYRKLAKMTPTQFLIALILQPFPHLEILPLFSCRKLRRNQPLKSYLNRYPRCFSWLHLTVLLSKLLS